ncbi:MAG: VWA domain-containing protein [Gammaproteobacteria bacterium]|nr:VWA domain-containing protein [Gammaproteobacteria bacterium]
MPETFHFLQPLWFLALLPLLALLWSLRKPGEQDNAWRRVCDAGLLPYLLTRPDSRASRLPLWLLAGGWLLGVVALADPVWEQQPQPVFRNEAARVVVLDLSNSMFSPDLKPSRLVRARYKVADILDQELDGQTALVVFAGDAFAVTPLTNDGETIRALLSPLEPGLMPSQGSRVDLGLQKAGHLLRQAGALRGDILVITDGYEDERALDAAAVLKETGYRVSVLGVGTEAGAPIPVAGGGFLRDNRDEVVLPGLDKQALQSLAAAGGGRYATINSDEADIKYLLQTYTPGVDEVTTSTGHTTDTWRSHGALIILLLLPLAALAFRRGWLMMVLVSVSVGISAPRPAMAAGWDDLWLRPDQQAARALQGGDPAQAARLADDPGLRGTAAYQAGDFEQALDAFGESLGQDADYNQGNALAQLGRYEEAIAAYDRALGNQPGMPDAEHNRAEVEKLLQQQQEQQQQDQGQQGEQPPENQQGQQGEQGEQQENQSGQAQQQAEDGSQGETGEQGDAQENASAESGQQQDDADNGQQQSADVAEKNNAEGEGSSTEQSAGRPGEQDGQRTETVGANPLDSEEQQAAEQWLRRIPDDPGGLLRRKFLYQYRQQAEGTARADQQAW